MTKFSFLPVPSTSLTLMAQVIMQNFRQIQAANRTNIITDENGVNRILLGRDPKGNYVLAITKPTYNVVEELENS